VWITSSPEAAKGPTHIALGNFDGVHLGHQQVMAQILYENFTEAVDQSGKGAAIAPSPISNQAVTALHTGILTSGYSQLPVPPHPTEADPLAHGLPTSLPTGPPLPKSGAYATVVTFSPHPHEFFSGHARPLLTPIAEKTWQLARLGIHQLVMLPFNAALAELSPEEFVEKILINGLNAQRISVGSDFHFGKGRSGNAQNLTEISAAHGVPVVQVALKHEAGDRISSSRIREALQTGQLETATKLLGRPYLLIGKVIKGKQLGRTIGFPTANLQLPEKKYLPRTGVYGVRVYGAEDSAEPLRGVMNIGTRPTVEGRSLSVEVHILNWTGDLYGQMLTVSLEKFVRPEQKFDSLDALKMQIRQDCEVALR